MSRFEDLKNKTKISIKRNSAVFKNYAIKASLFGQVIWLQ